MGKKTKLAISGLEVAALTAGSSLIVVAASTSPAGAVNTAPSYSGKAVAKYADFWWNLNNVASYPGTPFSNDCTDFVSQSLTDNGGDNGAQGGLPWSYFGQTDMRSFYLQNYPLAFSLTFTVAADLKNHLVNDGANNWGVYEGTLSAHNTNFYNLSAIPSTPSGWEVGDPLFYSLGGGTNASDVDHSAVKTAFGGEPQPGQYGYRTQAGYGDNGYASVSMVDQHSVSNYHYMYAEVDDNHNVWGGTELLEFVHVNGNSGT